MKRIRVPKRFVDEFNEQYFQDAVELAITVADDIQPTDKLYREALQAIYDAMQQEKLHKMLCSKKNCTRCYTARKEKLQNNPPFTGRVKREL